MNDNANEKIINNKVEFSFGWLALKLLGKSLYSNAWSAISELVANGFDAQAKNVFVYMNIIDKSNATIEILDDGTGMDSVIMDNYAKVGFNKRVQNSAENNDYLVMGRKGIGKLAALYLSENYYVITKTTEMHSTWKMVYQEYEDQEQKPFLSRILDEAESVNISCSEIWNQFTTGTLIKMNNVNLSGLGDTAFEALEKKLANYFSLDSMGKRKIMLCVQGIDSQPIEFKEVEKSIAFKNMVYIEYNINNSEILNSKIKEAAGHIIKFPYQKLAKDKYYEHQIDISSFQENDFNISGNYPVIDDNREIQKPYALRGWIGIHGTIEPNKASENDPNFSKSKFYNPIQLRLYVRNKLAVENFLNIISNTQAFVNYIEGEINFDILDDDDLPDIATSNRQSLDEHDDRVQILKDIASHIVSNLINKRVELRNKIKDLETKLQIRQTTSAKKQFSVEVEDEVSKFDDLKDEQKAELTQLLVNKIKGDVSPKSDYLVFFSHSSKDKIFTNFFYNYLISAGVKKEEVFYTSREDDKHKYENIDSLAIQIKNNIVRENVLLIYLTSKDYKESEYCMFEGGAGWATRSIGDYTVMSITYNEIPKFITNGKTEFCFMNNSKIELSRDAYCFIIQTLNTIIKHINSGRKINDEDEIALLGFP